MRGQTGESPNKRVHCQWIGGRSGIRTHGALLTHTRFPSVRLKPLGHPSRAAPVYDRPPGRSTPATLEPRPPAVYWALALASERVAPTRWASAAAMKSSSEPSSTAAGLPFSTPVRKSLTI